VIEAVAVVEDLLALFLQQLLRVVARSSVEQVVVVSDLLERETLRLGYVAEEVDVEHQETLRDSRCVEGASDSSHVNIVGAA